METQAEPEVQTPATPPVHENTLKARRFAERFAGKDTEAVIVIAKNGSFALLDMQKPGAYQLTPSNPLNERWREVLRKAIAVEKPKVEKKT